MVAAQPLKTSAAPLAPPSADLGRVINLIVVHCSATPDGDGLYIPARGALPARTPATRIDEWHAERGFQRTHPNAKLWQPHLPHIGYHFVISCDGSFEPGRSEAEMGAHAVGFNATSLSICMTGTDRFTQAQFDCLAELLRFLSRSHGIPLRRPEPAGRGGWRSGVCGHRDLSPDRNGNGHIEPFEWLKTCPGFDVGTYLERGLVPLPEDLYTGPIKGVTR
jgi:hypothetical protein